MQKSADVLLFLEFQRYDIAGCYTGKVFEYLYIAKEIWAIGESGPESGGDLIEQAKAGYRFGNNNSKIENMIKDLIFKKREVGISKDMNYIMNFDRRTLAEKMICLMK